MARQLLWLLSLLAAVATAQQNCRWDNDPCTWAMDGVCDQGISTQCRRADCYDCDPMQQYRYDCDGCVQAGGFWCPGDAVCLSHPQTADYFAAFENFEGVPFVNSCPSETDWKQTCGPLSTENVFTDPLYDAMAWEYKLINVEEVWRQGITGKGVHVRVTDDGRFGMRRQPK